MSDDDCGFPHGDCALSIQTRLKLTILQDTIEWLM